MTSTRPGRRRFLRFAGSIAIALGAGTAIAATTVATTAAASTVRKTPSALFHSVYAGVKPTGELDCNGDSPVQKPTRYWNCTDIRSFPGDDNANTWGGHFYDNGQYIGHDEPDTTFISNQPGSGGDVTWNITLGKDPTAAPTNVSAGNDVSHYFELTPAPWLSMAICDPNSYPELPCTPESDSNAASGNYPGGGSAFMEMQFYPPGEPPFVDSTSCNDKSWCAALTIDSLECTQGFAQCNGDCEEPLNAAFVQTDGVPAESPAPADYPDSQYNNAKTLYMAPGDRISVHIFDAPVPGEPGQKAVEVTIKDLTTGASGFMQASAKNGFENTSILDCSGTPFNFQPEYSTAAVGNYIPWAALQTNISTEFETGHFESCDSLAKPITNPITMPSPGDQSQTYNECVGGPYEDSSSQENAEAGDAFCWKAGDTHPGYDGTGSKTDPDEMTGCEDDVFQNGDLDYDGEPYWPEWPTSTSPTKYPSSFVESLPTTSGSQYPQLFFQTDAAQSEPECGPADPAGCTVPPVRVKNGKSTPTFYPYWSEADSHGVCSLDFGNVSSGVDTFNRTAEYGVSQLATLGYPEFIGNVLDNSCAATPSQGYLLAGKDGAIIAAGDAPALPSVHTPDAPVVGVVATPSGKGYFAVTDEGAVYTAGDAVFRGDLTTLSPAVHVDDVVAIAPTQDGKGYWLIGGDGGEFAFGDAKYHGSLPGLGIHVDDVVGMVAAPNGAGYLVLGADGGVFAFGSAKFHGSLPGIGVHVNDIRAVLPSPGGSETGYILVGADGGAFIFGHGVPYHGSLPGEGVTVSDIVGVALTVDGGGYWMAGSNGTTYPFGDARALPQTVTSSDLPITSIGGVNTSSPIG